MMMEARTSETFVNLYLTTRRYNPEDNHPRTNRREDLKSYKDRDDAVCRDFIRSVGILFSDLTFKKIWPLL
jgi:hypothetical protein